MDYKEFLSNLISGKSKIIFKEVKKNPCSGVIYVPKDYIGRKVSVIILDED